MYEYDTCSVHAPHLCLTGAFVHPLACGPCPHRSPPHLALQGASPTSCVACATGTTTPGEGAGSSAECTLSTGACSCSRTPTSLPTCHGAVPPPKYPTVCQVSGFRLSSPRRWCCLCRRRSVTVLTLPTLMPPGTTCLPVAWDLFHLTTQTLTHTHAHTTHTRACTQTKSHTTFGPAASPLAKFSFRSGFELEGQGYASFPKVDVGLCARRCILDKTCKSFDFIADV